MQKSLMVFLSILLVFGFAVGLLYSPVIAAPVKTPKPEIIIFYKDKKQTSKDKFLLSQGDALLTGTKIQASIENLGIGNYTLFLEKDGKERNTLAEKIKIDKKTKVLIPSADKWLTLSNNTGDYKLIVDNTTNGKVVAEFYFMVLPATEKVDATMRNIANLTENSNLAQAKFINVLKMNPKEIRNVIAYGKKTMSNIRTLQTRGVGSTIYKAYAPAVAHIVSMQNDKPLGAGSGIILNNQGDIITNFHVVEGADSYKVFLKNYKQYFFEAKLEYCNKSKDLAHIKLASAPPDIKTMTLGSNEDVLVGDDVHAIGHPLGQPWVYTRGPIGQILPDYSWKIKQKQYKATMIQTQTPINPGNSGGPLITDQGMVIGVNTFVTQNAQGVNFAVSVNDVKEFYQNRSSYPCDKVRVDPKPKPKVIQKKDMNGDGKIDKEVIDINGNGKGDLMFSDSNFDGKFDRIYLDRDEDGYFETRIIARDDMNVFLGDFDKDGKYDKIGYDYDKDFIPDKVEDYVG